MTAARAVRRADAVAVSRENAVPELRVSAGGKGGVRDDANSAAAVPGDRRTPNVDGDELLLTVVVRDDSDAFVASHFRARHRNRAPFFARDARAGVVANRA